MLGINTAPERNVLAVFFLQPLGVHATRRDLYRVENVKSQFDQIWDQIKNSPTTVIVNLGVRLALDSFYQAALFGFDHFAVHIGRDEPAVLPAYVVPIREDLKKFPHLFQIVAARLDVDFSNLVHQSISEFRLADQGHQEILETHRSGRLLEDAAADDGAAYQGIVGVFVEVFSLVMQPGIVLWGIWLRPGVGFQGLHSRFLDGKLHPVEIEPTLFGHIQFGAPAVDKGVVIAFLKNAQARRCRGRQLHHAEIHIEMLQQRLIQIR